MFCVLVSDAGKDRKRVEEWHSSEEDNTTDTMDSFQDLGMEKVNSYLEWQKSLISCVDWPTGCGFLSSEGLFEHIRFSTT